MIYTYLILQGIGLTNELAVAGIVWYLIRSTG